MLAPMGRVLIAIGIGLVVLGGLLLLAQRAGLSRLPGDIVYRRGNLTVFLPLGTSLLLSVLATLILLLLRKR
ncbi:MAG TPA: DUF2905 domain-containing protein [Candidatus Polarisedimenticolaceae bacterium]|nr:DUF2905 domain-containing protein [Candidatus Polarisedimenticolaceae bacterium]